jgi:hypothetical protein
MAAIALGLRVRRPDLTQEEVVVATIRYMLPCFDIVARERGEDPPELDERRIEGRKGAVLQRLRDMEHKRVPFTKVVLGFYDPRVGLDMRPLILDAVEAVMDTLPPAATN